LSLLEEKFDGKKARGRSKKRGLMTCCNGHRKTNEVKKNLQKKGVMEKEDTLNFLIEDGT